MKNSLIKLIALCAVCASFAVMPSVASAQGPRERAKIIRQAQHEIDRLQAARDRAKHRKEWNKVKMLDASIAKEREVIRIARHR